METVTFKEVHAELESEGAFLLQAHDTRSFEEKANFLKTVGFENSIATKIYTEVAKNSDEIKRLYQSYHEMYKFILDPQLERVCEKYNLYVRTLELFTGDIPEKNIADMRRFKVNVKDLDVRYQKLILFNKLTESTDDRRMRVSNIDNYYSPSSESAIMARVNEMDSQVLEDQLRNHNLSQIGLQEISQLQKGRVEPLIEIAATEQLFAADAFARSKARILKYEKTEAPAKNKVELDPIVLVKLRTCRVIVTAWGDEANDELVANQKLN